MTGETIRDLLEPLIGKSGSIFMVVNRTGPIGFASAENKKLTSVEPPRRPAPHRTRNRLGRAGPGGRDGRRMEQRHRELPGPFL